MSLWLLWRSVRSMLRLARWSIIASIAVTASSLNSTDVWAQATRTWVSGVGDDANPCSRTAPCKTLAGAISKTAAGGEINALDPAGYGAVTITKSITINLENTLGGVLTSGTNAIIVNAGANDVIVLRGLDIEGLTTSLNGIRFLAAKALFVEDSTIHRYAGNPGHGIDVDVANASNAPEVYISNVMIRDNGGAGVSATAAGGNVTITIDGSHLENNAFGVAAKDNTRVVVRDSVIGGNSTAGLQARAAAGTAEITAESVVLTGNGVGIEAGGAGRPDVARITNATIVNNTTGISIGAGATVASFGNNRIAGNGTNGAPNQSIAQQ